MFQLPSRYFSLPDFNLLLRSKLKSTVLAGTQDTEVVRRYLDYQKQLAECAGNDNSNQSRAGLLQTLALLYGATQGLKRPQDLLPASVDLQKRKLLKPQTMLNYLAAFSNFVDYCFLFEFSGDRRRDHVTMNGAIKNARKAYSTAAIKDYRFVAQETRAKVPTRSLVCKRLKGSFKLLEENLIESNLSYKEQQALNFYILQVRLNTRSGPILQLDWNDLALIEQTEEPVATDRHKTGKYFAVHLFVQEDQKTLLKKMRDCFFSENGLESQFIFASKKNKVERSISRHLQETFQDLFGDSPSEVRFNANSIRKFWERRWKEIKVKTPITEGVNKAHLAQTAHGEKTAEDVNIVLFLMTIMKHPKNHLKNLLWSDVLTPLETPLIPKI